MSCLLAWRFSGRGQGEKAALSGEGDGFGAVASSRRAASSAHSVDPLARQVAFPIQQHMPSRRSIRQKHADVTVLDPPGCSAVVPFDPDGLHALFEKPRLVNDQHRAWLAQLLHHVGVQVVTHRVGVPFRAPSKRCMP
jgi:hypothetical protein